MKPPPPWVSFWGGAVVGFFAGIVVATLWVGVFR
jgi:hypothetical protein